MKDYKVPSTQTDFESSNIQRISINEFYKSFGHLISPKDPERTQILQLREISNKFQGILKNGSLSPREYEALYKSVYTPTIKYILQGSSMTQKELNEVSIPDKHLFLQKLRYSKNMARDIVTGSNELGGLGMLDFYTEQGIPNIQILLKALADNQLVGDITRITIHKWKWHLGSGNDPFWKHKYQYPQDERQWLQNVQRFAVQNGMQICSGPNNFPLQRVHDAYIMEWAKEMGFTNF